eukprot:812174-Rhodomonas_salina.1
MKALPSAASVGASGPIRTPASALSQAQGATLSPHEQPQPRQEPHSQLTKRHTLCAQETHTVAGTDQAPPPRAARPP